MKPIFFLYKPRVGAVYHFIQFLLAVMIKRIRWILRAAYDRIILRFDKLTFDNF